MAVIVFVALGIAAGVLLDQLARRSRERSPSRREFLLLGIVGSIVGGGAWNLLLSDPEESAVTLASCVAATIGSLVSLVLAWLITDRLTPAN